MITGSPIHQSDCRFVQELQERGIGIQYENQELTSPPPYGNKALIIGKLAVALPGVLFSISLKLM